MDSVLVDGTAGRKGVRIFLDDHKGSQFSGTARLNLKYWGGTYLHMFKVLDVFALCFYDFPDDIIACGFLCVCRSWYFR